MLELIRLKKKHQLLMAEYRLMQAKLEEYNRVRSARVVGDNVINAFDKFPSAGRDQIVMKFYHQISEIRAIEKQMTQCQQRFSFKALKFVDQNILLIAVASLFLITLSYVIL